MFKFKNIIAFSTILGAVISIPMDYASAQVSSDEAFQQISQFSDVQQFLAKNPNNKLDTYVNGNKFYVRGAYDNGYNLVGGVGPWYAVNLDTNEVDKYNVVEDSYTKVGEITSSVDKSTVSQITLTINANQVNTDVNPVMINNRILIPIKAIMDANGGTTKWNPDTKTITASNQNHTISLKINSNIAIVDGKNSKLDVPAQILNGRTMVPLRFVAESFGYKVYWNPDNQVVDIGMWQD